MAEKELSVKMLGEITLSCGSASVSMSGSRSYKTWLMVAHLLSHRHRWVPQEEIIQSLGGGESEPPCFAREGCSSLCPPRFPAILS